MLTNEMIKKFSNEKMRTQAKRFLNEYHNSKKIQTEWNARIPELGNPITAGISETIDDGATEDGRPIIVGNDILGNIQAVFDFIAFCEANDSARINQWIRMVSEELTP